MAPGDVRAAFPTLAPLLWALGEIAPTTAPAPSGCERFGHSEIVNGRCSYCRRPVDGAKVTCADCGCIEPGDQVREWQEGHPVCSGCFEDRVVIAVAEG